MKKPFYLYKIIRLGIITITLCILYGRQRKLRVYVQLELNINFD